MLSSGLWRSQQSSWSCRRISPALLEKVPTEKKRSTESVAGKPLPGHPLTLIYRLVSALHTTSHPMLILKINTFPINKQEIYHARFSHSRALFCKMPQEITRWPQEIPHAGKPPNSPLTCKIRLRN